MKISEHWLKEWVNPACTREQLCERMTLSGLEIESITPVAEKFSNVIVGKILNVEKHPEAERLSLCDVEVGKEKILKIVCGATNVKAGMKVPTAIAGAHLPNDLKIAETVIRNITSQGMLCSASELGLTDKSEGLIELPKDAVIGESIWDYLKLSDYVWDVSITPNRGDCLSVMGLAKDISALTETKLISPEIKSVKEKIKDTFPVSIESPEDCPRYVGRIIRNIKADADTPMWMRERLRRAGVRVISPVVDVTNYVLLELGQPMHAFDLDKLNKKIIVRKAKQNEKLELLDGQTVELTSDTLLIADQEKPLAIAGAMGGLESSVTLLTQNIFLEIAYFKPESIARAVRRFKLTSEGCYRFERGVDPELQKIAMDRATELLLQITGGEAGPVIEVSEKKYLPQPKEILLRKSRIHQILKMLISDEKIELIFKNLELDCKKNSEGWRVIVPPRRFDLSLEIDLIEEIFRVYGAEHLPTHNFVAPFKINPQTEKKVSQSAVCDTLCHLGYQEVITYSFVNKKIQALLNPSVTAKELLNPITAEMDVMRTNLWPGFINTLLFNQNRQQNRIRVFEIGLRFTPDNKQEKMLAGLISGEVLAEQWSVPKREVDFFDMKGDLQNLFLLTHAENEFTFKRAEHPALHPGQTAEIFRGDQCIGILGALHPHVLQTLQIIGKVFVFELALDLFAKASVPASAEISKFPEVRRDLALIVAQTISAEEIEKTITDVAKELLKEIFVFDVYQGKGIPDGHKSIALALTLQHSSRTLIDQEVVELLDRVVVTLKGKFNAQLRG